MKTFINYLTSFVLMLAMVSCVSFKDGETYFGAVGVDAEEITIPNKLIMKKVNMSNSFKAALAMVKKMWDAYLMLKGIEYIGDLYYDHAGKQLSYDHTVKLNEMKNAQSVAEAAAKQKELETMFKYAEKGVALP